MIQCIYLIESRGGGGEGGTGLNPSGKSQAAIGFHTISIPILLEGGPYDPSVTAL